MLLIKVLLLFTNPVIGVLIMSLLYAVYNRRLTGNLMFNCMFINGSLNAILKSIFKVPLHISLNNSCWWSFPSGHMQYGIVLWGMLWINSKFNLKLLYIFIGMLMLSSLAINYNQYHSYFEMIGAIPPAILILYLYYITRKKGLSLIKVNILSIVFQGVVLLNVESPCINYKMNWLYLNFGANLGFLLTSFLYNHEQKLHTLQVIKEIQNNKMKFCLALLSLGVFQYIIAVFPRIDVNFICGIFLPLVLFFISKLHNPQNV